MNRTHVIRRATVAGRPRPRRVALWAAGTAIATAAGGGLLAGPAAATSSTTDSFSYTGGTQTWTVPAGVTSATFTLDGASGGAGTGNGTAAAGGKGGELVATLAVTPGDTYTVVVGGHGVDAGAGGYNGGGSGGSGGNAQPGDPPASGGGGGGATDVRFGGTALSDRVLVAGGGGGSSGSGTFPFTVDDPSSAGGDGGAASTDATAGGTDKYGGSGGLPGTGTAGGAGGVPPANSPGASYNGGAGSSGTGGPGGSGYGGGGGGGGGLFGGGGGGATNATPYAGGGGGGGSGYAASSAAGVRPTAGVNTGDGKVSITYTVGTTPPGPTVTGTPPGATVGTAYTPFAFTTTGSPTCSVSSGSLPSGLTLDGSTCTISGTPTSAGSYPITVRATNGNPPDATDTFTLTVTQPSSVGAPTISGTPPDAAVGTPYTAFPFTTTGSPACSVSSGSLPSGLALDGPTCTLSGTPAANTGGTYPITVTATNGNDPDATDSFTLAVTQAPSMVGTVPDATAGQPYSYQLQLAGYPTPTVSVSPNGAALPSWLTLDSDGLLHGTAPAALSTTFGIWLDLTNSVSTASYGLNFSVGGLPAQITSGAPTDITYDQPYTFTFTGTGIPAPFFRVASGQLPYGLTLDHDSGVLSGTTTQLGDFPVTIGVGNGFGTEAQQSYTLHVTGTAPEVVNSPPAAQVNTSYYFTFDTGASNPAPSFSITSGSLPAGLTLYTNGVISGFPTAMDPGSPVVIDLTNGVSPDRTITITIPVGAAAPSLTGTPPTTGTVGGRYYYRYTVGGTPAPTLSFTGGTPPPGLTIDNYGELQGTPTTPGVYPFTITATNGATPDATVSLTITVSGVAPTISGAPPASLGQGSSIFFTYALTGQPTPTTAVTGGSLPQGLHLDSSGHLTGAPTTPGVYTFTVTATNGVSPDATTTDTITVTPAAPTISGTPPPATVGERYAFAFTTTGTPTPTVTRARGSLPPGLWLTRSGVVQGVPRHAGTYRFTVRAANGVGTATTELVTMRVLPLPLAIDDVTAQQSASGTTRATFTVSLSGASALPVTVHWATRNGTAKVGEDYSKASGILTFAPGQTSKTITVSVRPERRVEGPETFFVALSRPRFATIARGTGRGSIVHAG